MGTIKTARADAMDVEAGRKLWKDSEKLYENIYMKSK